MVGGTSKSTVLNGTDERPGAFVTEMQHYEYEDEPYEDLDGCNIVT